MNQPHHSPLTHESAWPGLWVRRVSGPTPRGVTITYESWHYVASLEPPRGTAVGSLVGIGSARRCRVLWPSGGARLEVANTWGGPPETGGACLLCCSKLNVARGNRIAGRTWEAAPPVYDINDLDRHLASLVPGYVAQELEQLLPRVVRELVAQLLEEGES